MTTERTTPDGKAYSDCTVTELQRECYRLRHLVDDTVEAPQLKRMWVNQPSTLQPHNALHGMRVLAFCEYDDTYRVYFLTGEIVSQQMPASVLSIGWPTKLTESVYPSAEGYVATEKATTRKWTFVKTGEFRTPKKGEWYLSGAIPAAYCAPNDLPTQYHILRRRD